MKLRFLVVLALIMGVGMVNTSAAQELLPHDNGIFTYHNAPDYRESESHPLRTIAYVLHPVGWMLREGLYRPWSAAASSSRFTRSFFGYRDPFDFRDAFCFDPMLEVPDCKQLPPYTMLGGQPGGAGADAGMEGAEGKQVQMIRQVYFPDVAFEFDKSSLTALGKGRVRQIAQLLAADPGMRVTLEGHTDPRGGDEYNQKLGQRRAQRVVDELVELGIDPARMAQVSMGEAQLLFTEDEEWAHAVNRRVHVVVDTGVPAAAPAAPVAEEGAAG